MTLLLKDPDATLDYAVNWGLDYLTDDCLAQSRWSIGPEEPSGASVVGSQFDPKTSTVQLAGGVPGHIYRLTNHVVTVNGLEDSRSIILRVEQR